MGSAPSATTVSNAFVSRLMQRLVVMEDQRVTVKDMDALGELADFKSSHPIALPWRSTVDELKSGCGRTATSELFLP
jgi:hypothetical protein